MRLHGPAHIYGLTDDHSVYSEWHAAKIAKRPGEKVHIRQEELVAYVNEGRLVALCPNCNAGIAVHTDWPDARCFECGAIYYELTLPSDYATIEDVLLARPRRNQNWAPTESVADIAEENFQHGLTIFSSDVENR